MKKEEEIKSEDDADNQEEYIDDFKDEVEESDYI